MTKDEALAFDLALEALRPFSTPNWAGTGVDKANEAITAITAIKQARLAPVQEPAEVLGHNGWGFPIKAAAPVQEDWGPGPHEYHSLTAAPVQEPPPECQTEAEKRAYAFGWWKALEANRATPVQEPVAWRYRGIFHEFDPSDWAEGPVTPLYTTPPAAQRQWVGLTQQDINIAFDDTQEGGGFDEFARAIEAKLRSKNNDS